MAVMPSWAQSTAEVAELQVNAYIVTGNSLLPTIEVEQAVSPYLGPGRTLDDINEARAALEKRYQAQGYQSVLVELPEQQVRNGYVQLRVVEASVGRLRVEGARYYSPRDIREAVPALAEGGVPNLERAQAELAALNRGPGRQVTPLLKPGTTPGTMDVVLQVEDRNPLHGGVELHNDHSDNTEELRASVDLRYDNLWQRDHSLSLSYFLAPEDRESAEVFSFSYVAPLPGSAWTLLAYGYDSDSSVATLGGTTVLGRGSAVGLRGLLQLPAGEGYSHSASVGLDYKKSDEDIRLGSAAISSPVEYVTGVLGYSSTLFGNRTVSELGATVTAGLRGVGSSGEEFRNKRASASPNFVALKLDGSHSRTLPRGFELTLRGAAQVADQPLVSSEQFSAGGAQSVRGYLQSEAIGDQAASATLELSTPSLAGRIGWSGLGNWRWLAFVDAAHALLLDVPPEQIDESNLAGAGVGTRLTLFGALYGDLDVAWALRDGLATEAGDSALHFRLRGEF